MAFLSLVRHRACAETKDTFLVTERINFNKTRHYTTLHYTFSFSLVCMMPLTIFFSLGFSPWQTIDLGDHLFIGFPLVLELLGLAVVNVMLFGYPVQSIDA